MYSSTYSFQMMALSFIYHSTLTMIHWYTHHLRNFFSNTVLWESRCKTFHSEKWQRRTIQVQKRFPIYRQCLKAHQKCCKPCVQWSYFPHQCKLLGREAHWIFQIAAWSIDLPISTDSRLNFVHCNLNRSMSLSKSTNFCSILSHTNFHHSDLSSKNNHIVFTWGHLAHMSCYQSIL